MNRYYKTVYVVFGVLIVLEVRSSQSSVIPFPSKYNTVPLTFSTPLSNNNAKFSSPEPRTGIDQSFSKGQKNLTHNDSKKQEAAIEVVSKSLAKLERQQESVDESLFEAIDRGDIGAVEQAFKNGAHVNAKNGFYSTPLHVAAAKGDKDVLSLLLELGAEISVRDALGDTPFSIAANSDCITLLQEYAKPS